VSYWLFKAVWREFAGFEKSDVLVDCMKFEFETTVATSAKDERNATQQ